MNVHNGEENVALLNPIFTTSLKLSVKYNVKKKKPRTTQWEIFFLSLFFFPASLSNNVSENPFAFYNFSQN